MGAGHGVDVSTIRSLRPDACGGDDQMSAEVRDPPKRNGPGPQPPCLLLTQPVSSQERQSKRSFAHVRLTLTLQLLKTLRGSLVASEKSSSFLPRPPRLCLAWYPQPHTHTAPGLSLLLPPLNYVMILLPLPSHISPDAKLYVAHGFLYMRLFYLPRGCFPSPPWNVPPYPPGPAWMSLPPGRPP